MRQIVLDTETTGLETKAGHRIIEIGATEIVNRRLTGNVFHRYINPDRVIDEGAIAVHGIRNEQLVNEPRFPEIAEELLDFLRESEVVIHNAPFDVGFLEHELKLMKHARPQLAKHCTVLDTLKLARKLHPGQRNSLDALCRRYEIDNSRREFHGALLDANLLADVYLAMTGGQGSLVLEADHKTTAGKAEISLKSRPKVARKLKVLTVDAEDLSMHEELMQKISERCEDDPVWWQLKS